MSNLSQFFGGSGGSSREPLYPALKASIVLFDCNPGTRTWTVPEGVNQIRAFVVGSGGPTGLPTESYSSNNTTSSFGGLISATGGGAGGTYNVPGEGIGGDVNSRGGPGGANQGGAAGHAFNGNSNPTWNLDGWKIGLLPGIHYPGKYGVTGRSSGVSVMDAAGGIGAGGGSYISPTNTATSLAGPGGIGGGSGPYNPSGGTKQYGGAGGGYAEKVINVTPGQIFNYTVGTNAGFAGPGLVGIEVIA